MKEDDLFEDVVLDSPMHADTSVKDVVKHDGPPPTSPEWHDYIFSLFEEDELFDGRPVCGGLRRVAELVLGPIMVSRPVQVVPPENASEIGRATVVWELIFETGHTFGDVADCWEGNTDDAFCVFNTATAATRAESRALRKALRLRTVAAEEMTSKNTTSIVRNISAANANKSTEGEYDDSQRMTDPQANFIDAKAQQLNVDVEKFFKEVFNLNVKRKVDKRQASAAIEKLNEYQQDRSLVSDSITPYKEWRTK